MEYNRIINGLPVCAAYSDESVQQIFLPLLEGLANMQKKAGRRILVMLAAPPAAGKSTMVSFLQDLAGSMGVELTAIGMDGFHRYQDYLLSHTVELDGEIVPMVKVKGSPISFDLAKLQDRIERLLREDECPWPHYDRKLHNPVEAAVKVTGDIVLLEGNYLLLDEPGWRELRSLADYTVFVAAEEADVKERLVSRKAASGMPREEAERFVERSDLRNVRLCLQKRLGADLNLKMLSNGEYVFESGKLP